MQTEINGFKIIQELPVIKKEIMSRIGKKIYAYRKFVLAVCKQCGGEWTVCKASLSKTNSCGCKRAIQYKPLPAEINGFKIIKDLGNDGNIRKALVECKICKKEYKTHPWQLVDRKHCGCITRGTKVSKYRHTHKRLCKIFVMMKARCNNPKDSSYAYYGAKGIKICDKWMADPDAFCDWALSNGYRDDLTIDRIDGSIGYSPDNCRWETRLTQARNRNYSIMSMSIAKQIRADHASLNQNELAAKYKVSRATISNIVLNKTWKES